jgi:hypothetical protein
LQYLIERIESWTSDCVGNLAISTITVALLRLQSKIG